MFSKCLGVKLLLLSGLFSALVGFSGCNGVKYSASEEAKYVKPTVAVMSFENRAPMAMKWNLGDGLADQLIDRLINTKRYVVLERQQLNAILAELRRTRDKRFSKYGQPDLGQLKHVRYLVKGTITDFGHVETVEGFWRLFDWGLFGSSSYAEVGATIYVVDVQSGQIVDSESVSAKIRDNKDHENVDYSGMAFGSFTFYRTSLGKATSKMLDKAVRKIAKTVADQPYQPKIASFVNNQVVINGGRDRRIEVGSVYAVRPRAQLVVDPDSSDILGHIAGKNIGSVQVVQVAGKFSMAKVLSGSSFEPGQTLFLCKEDEREEVAKIPVKSSSY
ncbi:MAG: hypothetical protein J7M40_14270 [Planctomycetes bacterium]|nr:hypothetical protein [Planctomycetota bacterium]